MNEYRSGFWSGIIYGTLGTMIGLVFMASVLDEPAKPSDGTHYFVELHREIPTGWNSTYVYVLRHSSGACLVYANGSIADVDEKICAAHMKVEKPK